jgi:integrase
MGISVREKIKGSNGFWVFVRAYGQRVSVYAGDKETAEDLAKDIDKEIRTGKFNIAAMKAARASAVKEEKPNVPTLGEFFDKTMSPLWEASLAAATFSRYELSFRLHIKPVLGEVRLDELTRDQAKELVVTLLQKNANKRTHGEDRPAEEPERKLSKDSIRNVVATLRAMLNEAVERKLIAVNPATKLGKLYKEAGTVREQVDPFTAEEIPTLLDATRTHFRYENYVVTLTLFHTGLRASELAGLQWPDLDFRGRFITVRRQYKDGKITRTKTKKIRKIDISDVLLHELQTLRKRRQEEYLGRGKNEIPEWVFLSPGQIIWSKDKPRKPVGHAEGQPLDMKHFRGRVFLKACDKAGIRRRRLHDTRHTFASILLMNGESPAYVKDQLGHSSIKMTVDIYGHWIPGSNRQAVNKLPSLETPRAHAQAAAGD